MSMALPTKEEWRMHVTDTNKLHVVWQHWATCVRKNCDFCQMTADMLNTFDHMWMGQLK